MKLPRTALGFTLATALALPATAQIAPAPATVPAAAPTPTAPAAPVISERAVAIVNDEIITTYDLGQRMLLLVLEARVRPTQEQIPAIQREALRLLIDERLQMQELRNEQRERKIDTLIATDAQVDSAIRNLARQSETTPEQLVASIRAAGVQESTLRERLRTQLSWERWIGGRYGASIRVGREQVQATLKRIVESSAKPQYWIREIFIEAARHGGQADAEAGAQQLFSQIQQGAPFESVARQFSSSASAAQGGDTGWLTAEELPAPVRPVVEQLAPGQVSQPIPTSDGVYLVQLRQRSSGAGATAVTLKQAAVRLAADASATDIEAARTKLESLRPRLTGCDEFETRAGAVEGVIAGDLGEAEITDLAPEFQTVAQQLNAGQISAPIRTEVGLHLVAVCGKRAAGARVPTADQVEDNLLSQQLAMVSRRYLRDLRNSATIETR
ncbi:MAG TPA: peptidylprolyl isomerase [Caulobacteraceae bacterium]